MKLEGFRIWIGSLVGPYSSSRFFRSLIMTGEHAEEERHFYIFFDKALQKEMLDQSVRKHFSGDVRIGCFLKEDCNGTHVYLKNAPGLCVRFEEQKNVVTMVSRLMEDLDIQQSRTFDAQKNEMIVLTKTERSNP